MPRPFFIFYKMVEGKNLQNKCRIKLKDPTGLLRYVIFHRCLSLIALGLLRCIGA